MIDRAKGGQGVETRENRAPVWGVGEAGEERAGSGRNHATMLTNSHSKKVVIQANQNAIQANRIPSTVKPPVATNSFK